MKLKLRCNLELKPRTLNLTRTFDSMLQCKWNLVMHGDILKTQVTDGNSMIPTVIELFQGQVLQPKNMLGYCWQRLPNLWKQRVSHHKANRVMIKQDKLSSVGWKMKQWERGLRITAGSQRQCWKMMRNVENTCLVNHDSRPSVNVYM